MAVQINELDVQVDNPSVESGARRADQASPLPELQELWRAQWIAAGWAEQQCRWSPIDRDDER
jgi:hypothetical protein